MSVEDLSVAGAPAMLNDKLARIAAKIRNLTALGKMATSNVTGIEFYTPQLSPVAVAANTTAEQTFTVKGLTSGVVSVSKRSAQAGLGIVGARVSALDTLAITFSNNTAGAITPTANETYDVAVLRSA